MRIMLFIMVLGLSACGGSGGGGASINESAATFTGENQQALSVASVEATKQAVSSDSANDALPIGIESNHVAANIAIEIVYKTTLDRVNLPIAADVSDDFCDTGSVSFSGSDPIKFTYNGCVSDGVTIDGVAIVSYSDDGDSFRVEYKNFKINYGNGNTDTINSVVSCSGLASATFEFECSVSSDFQVDGRNYRVENSVVSGDESNGFNVDARVYDEEFGFIDVTSTGLIFDCDNGYPSTGTITMTDASGTTGTLTFDGCASFSLTIDGVSETFDW